jgi:hypothetical protein
LRGGKGYCTSILRPLTLCERFRSTPICTLAGPKCKRPTQRHARLDSCCRGLCEQSLTHKRVCAPPQSLAALNSLIAFVEELIAGKTGRSPPPAAPPSVQLAFVVVDDAKGGEPRELRATIDIARHSKSRSLAVGYFNESMYRVCLLAPRPPPLLSRSEASTRSFSWTQEWSLVALRQPVRVLIFLLTWSAARF